MTYRPTDEVYGPPLTLRLPSLLYLGLALAVVAAVVVGEVSPVGTWLHTYVVLGDANRYIGSRVFAALITLSAVASVVQAGMRGVRVRGDGLEYRDLVSAIWPRVRRYKWPQIDRIVLDRGGAIILDLWNGDRALLPPVSDAERLAATLEKVALARAIPVTGGRGVDEIPEAGDYE